ncbi:hypothetical protein BDN67DRAFT_1045317, partial [Paxillus ammoniavirescens]
EAAHLIWVIRCERVIRGTTCTRDTIVKRWLHKINHRLQMDCQLSTTRLRHPPSKQKVTLTWQKGNLISLRHTIRLGHHP